MHPRLQLIQDGKLVAIQFGDAITLCATGNTVCLRLSSNMANRSVKSLNTKIG